MTPARRTDERAGLQEREFAFGEADFQEIAAMLYADSGIFLSPHKQPLVYGRLVKRLRVLGMSSFRDYCALLAGSEGLDERQQMLSALTTNVTAFFRERHHFERLRSVELPRLLKAARDGGRVRLWSAGCSRGHEPYSMAMTILSVMPEAANYDVKILASDIDPAVVDVGRAGIYPADELNEVSKADRDKYFRAADARADSFAVSDQLKRLVTFRELNLMGSWPMKGRFQAVFCRNVAIYFDAPTQSTVWSRLASVLSEGGLLCIGHSERLAGEAQHRLAPVGTTMYTLTTGAAA